MGATINPLKLRIGTTQPWPTLFFTHTEKSYPAIVHPFMNIQQGLLEGLRGLTVYKYSLYHDNKKQIVFLFNDVKILNTGNSLFVLIYLNSDLLLYRSQWFKKFLRIRRVPWIPKYAGLKKRTTPYHLLGRRLQARRRKQKKEKKSKIRFYFWWFTRKRRRFRWGVKKWWRLNHIRLLLKKIQFRKKMFLAEHDFNMKLIKARAKKNKKPNETDTMAEINEILKVYKPIGEPILHDRRKFKRVLQRSLVFKRKKFIRKYRIFYLIFYFYPLLASLKTLINRWLLQTFKQLASSEVFFLRSSTFHVTAYSIVKYAHILFTEILLDKNIKKKIEYKKVFFRTLKHLERLFRARHINGYKLALTGRFSRRDRLTFVWRYGGDETPFSTVKMPVDYSIDYVWLKHGVCVFEVWICKTGNKPIRNERD